MRTIRTKVYQFSELSEQAKQKIITQRIEDMMQWEHSDNYENWPEYKKAIDRAEEMQTPWFAGSYVWEYCGADIVAALNDCKESQYTKDGNFFTA